MFARRFRIAMTSKYYTHIQVSLFVDGHWRPIEPDIVNRDPAYPNSRVYRPWRRPPPKADKYLLDVYIQRDRRCISPNDIECREPCPIEHWDLPCTTLEPHQVIALRYWLEIASVDAQGSRVQK